MGDLYTNPPQSRNEAILRATIDGTEYTNPPESRIEDLLLELKGVIKEGGSVEANPEGTAAETLTKLKVDDTIYSIPSGGGGGGTSDYTELDNKPQINGTTLAGNKTAAELGLVGAETGKGLSTNDFTDAAKDKLDGIAAGAQVNTIESITLNGSAISPDANKNVALTVITNAVDNLVNYYLKSETYTKTEVDTIAANIKNSRMEVVSSLPTTDIQTNVIYLVPKSSPDTGNGYDEYINLDGTTSGWELIGNTDIDLSGYVTTSDLNTALASYVTSSDLSTTLSSYATTAAAFLTSDTAETTLDDADTFPFYDTSATAKKKGLLSTLKAFLKTYFDTLYSTVTTLAGLSDVQISSPSDGQILQYDAASQKWVNEVVGKIPVGAVATPTDDIQTWLHCAAIWNKNYTLLSEVLADSSTLLALISTQNAVDYMVRSTTWASDVTANSTAMSYIGTNNYCSDELLDDSTWRTAICNSSYFESILTEKVPTMTDATHPSGKVTATSYDTAGTGYQPYKAFDGNYDYSSNGWMPSGLFTASENITYNFITKTLNVCKIKVYYKGGGGVNNIYFKVQSSSDGVDWSDITNEVTFTSVVNQISSADYIANNIINGKMFRLAFTRDSTNTSGMGLKIQFYGRTAS